MKKDNLSAPIKSGHLPKLGEKNKELLIGCHVSIAGGIWNAPKNAGLLGCETFQIFTRPPQGGNAVELKDLIIERFKIELHKYELENFVVHTPYFINFGSGNPRIYHGSVNIVKQDLERASLLGAKYLMTHLGSGKDLGKEKAIKQTKEGLKEVLDGYEGKTEFLIEIAAGSGEILGSKFEELDEIIEPIKKAKGFGGICFDTQHAWASGYDLRDTASVESTFEKFNKSIGLEWLKMSHVNDSKIELSANRDRHEHIGEGKIGKAGFEAILRYFGTLTRHQMAPSPVQGEGKLERTMPLILETKPDKVKADIKFLKILRNKIIK